MTADELRAAAGELTELHARFAACFGRKEAQGHAELYVRGLLGPGRKSVEPMGLAVAHQQAGEPRQQSRVLALQRFLSVSPWRSEDVQEQIQALFAERLMPSAVGTMIGTVGIIDESSFVKRGTHSAGVARQHCGRLGKTENCQVGVFLVGVTPAGSALLEHQLYLPDVWCRDERRRAKAGVPAALGFQTKPEIAGDLVERIGRAGHVRFDWVTGDDVYGRSGPLLARLEAAGQKYVMEVPSNIRFWVVDPAGIVPADTPQRRLSKTQERHCLRTAQRLARELPPEAWQPIRLREGGTGPLVSEFARLRVWAVRDRTAGPPVWLLFRRATGAHDELTCWVSNAAAEVPLEVLAHVAGTRWRVEEFFEDGKGHLGLADYEARGWTSWHHHVSLVALAHLYVTLTRERLQSRTPELTLDMAVRLIASVIERPTLTPDDALEVVQYHLRRNRIARNSHRKTWLNRHPELAEKLML